MTFLTPDLWQLSVPVGNLVLRAVVVYLAVLLLLRSGGKRQLGQMSATEFVAILLISNAVQNAMNAGDNSLAGGLILAGTLVAMSVAISYLTFRSRRMRTLFEGTPTLLVHKGKTISANLLREKLPHAEFEALLRKQGVHRISEIDTAILEADGTLSVTRSEKPPSEPHPQKSHPSSST